jgi:hypothetical protein
MRNIAKILSSAALLAGVALSSEAGALPIARIYDEYPASSTSTQALFTPDQPLSFNGAMRLDRMNEQTARAASQNYYDFDAIITLGSLALAGGALAVIVFSASRRPKADAADERHEPASNWRESVLRNLEADLTAYARSWRRAA